MKTSIKILISLIFVFMLFVVFNKPSLAAYQPTQDEINAANKDKTLPKTVTELYEWAKNDPEKFMNINVQNALIKYGTGSSNSLTGDVIYPNYNWNCINSHANASQDRFEIKNIIDVYADGTAQIGAFRNTIVNVPSSDTSGMKRFNTMAYFVKNYVTQFSIGGKSGQGRDMLVWYYWNHDTKGWLWHYSTSHYGEYKIWYPANDYDGYYEKNKTFWDACNSKAASAAKDDKDVRIIILRSAAGQDRIVFTSYKTKRKSIKLVKMDADTQKPLKGAKFVLKKVGSPNDGYYIKSSGSTVTYTKSASSAKVFTTNANGTVEIAGLKDADVFQIIEKETPDGYKIQGTIPNVTVGDKYRYDVVKSITYTNNNKYYENLTGSKQLKDYISTLVYVLAGVNYGPDSTDVKNIIKDIDNSGYYDTIMTNGANSDAEKFTNKYNLITFVLQYLIDEKGYSVLEMDSKSQAMEKLNNMYRRMLRKTGKTVVDMPTVLQDAYWAQWNEQLNARVIYNESQDTQLIIKKYAEGTTVGLKGAEFIICKDVACTDVVETGTTNSTGTLTIKGLEPGTYYVKETKAPTNYELSTNNPQKVVLTSGDKKTVEVVFENKKKDEPDEPEEPTPPGDGVIKVIADTDNVPLEGMKFAIKNWDPDNKEYTKYKPEPDYDDYYYTEYYTVRVKHVDEDGNVYYTTERRSRRKHDTAQYNADHKEWEKWKKYNDYYKKSQTQYVGEGISLENGKITMTLDDPSITEPGTYTLYEVGSENPYFNVRIGDQDVSEKEIGSGYEVSGGGLETTGDRIIENERTFVDIEGVVYVDEREGKQWVGDDLYSPGEGVDGVKITLKRNGQIIDEIYSGSDSRGAKLEEGKYKFWGTRDDLKIEAQHIEEYEIEFEYNGMKYHSVTPHPELDNGSKAEDIKSSRDSLNQRYNTITNSSDVEYNTGDHKSEIIYSPNEIYAQDKYHVVGSTNGVYSLKDGYNPRYDEIENVNFGIIEREHPDMALVKDVENAIVEINGFDNVYRYGQKSSLIDSEEEAIKGTDEYDNEFKVGVSFKEKYSDMTYSRPVYEEDFYYKVDQANKDGELNARVTYKLTLKNQSTNLTTKINTIVDYFDTNYYLIGAGTGVDESGHITGNLTCSAEQSYNSEYKKVIVTANSEVAPQMQTEIYIQFGLNKQAIENAVNNRENLENVAEVASYTTTDSNGQLYAGVDTDSAPENATPGNTDTYEDDTDRAPGFRLVLQDRREMYGKVFEDKDTETEELKTGRVRQGNGRLDSNEPGIAGVKVTLLKTDGTVARMYNGTQWVDAVTTTSSEGEYSFVGYVPDYYIVQYEWGDDKYRVQDYKSTIVDKSSFENKGASRETEWYKDPFKQMYPGVEWDESSNTEIRVSDAVDDFEMRQNVDKETETMTYGKKQQINQSYGNEIADSEKVITKMDSYTPEFMVDVEYTPDTPDMDQYEEDANGNIIIENGYAVKKPEYRNIINSVDFGIIERSRQGLMLEKRIKKITVKLANGMTLSEADIDENGTITNHPKYIVYIPKSEQNEDEVKIEIDDELVKSVRITVIYEFKVTNISEVDYSTKEFYLYGEGHENKDDVARLTPEIIIDYTDNDLGIDENNWHIKSEAEKAELITEGLLAPELQETLTLTNKVVGIEELKDSALSALEDQNIATFDMIGVRDMTNNEGDRVENHAEVMQIGKTWGSTLITIPGNYVPGNDETHDYDDDKAEEFYVVPATGLSVDYTGYVILGLSILGIIAAGVVLIKKYVLK